MTRPQSAIAATGVHKAFGDHLVLDGVDLDVADGTIFALLGPNGAGKTTMVQILSTLIGADAGEVRVAGHDLARDADAVRAAIGVTGQFSAVDNLLTGQENLILMADLHHLGRADGRRRAAERAVLLTAALDIDLPSGRSDWAYGQVLEYIAKGDEERTRTSTASSRPHAPPGGRPRRGSSAVPTQRRRPPSSGPPPRRARRARSSRRRGGTPTAATATHPTPGTAPLRRSRPSCCRPSRRGRTRQRSVRSLASSLATATSGTSACCSTSRPPRGPRARRPLRRSSACYGCFTQTPTGTPAPTIGRRRRKRHG